MPSRSKSRMLPKRFKSIDTKREDVLDTFCKVSERLQQPSDFFASFRVEGYPVRVIFPPAVKVRASKHSPDRRVLLQLSVIPASTRYYPKVQHLRRVCKSVLRELREQMPRASGRPLVQLGMRFRPSQTRDVKWREQHLQLLKETAASAFPYHKVFVEPMRDPSVVRVLFAT